MFDFSWCEAIHKVDPLVTLNFSRPQDKPLPVVLCHYAMRTWDRSHYGSYHLYGHSHGKLERHGWSMDVGVDCFDFYPVSLRQVIEELNKKGV